MSNKHTKNGDPPKYIGTIPNKDGTRRHNHRCVYYDNLTKGCKCKQLPYAYECFGSAHCDYYKEDTNVTSTPPKDFIVIGAKLVHFKFGVLTIYAIYRDKVELVDEKNYQHKFSKSALRILYEEDKLTINQNK